MSTGYDIFKRVDSNGNTVADLELCESSSEFDLSARVWDGQYVVASIDVASNLKPKIVLEMALRTVQCALWNVEDPDKTKAEFIQAVRDLI